MITKTHLAIAVGPCVDMGAEHAMVEIMGNSSATISFFDNPNLTCSAVPVRNETYLLNHCDNVTSTTDHLWTLGLLGVPFSPLALSLSLPALLAYSGFGLRRSSPKMECRARKSLNPKP